MTFKTFLKEEWATSFKVDNQTVEIFKNPKPSEIDRSEVRAFLDKAGNLWVWDGRLANHGEAARKLQLKDVIPIALSEIWRAEAFVTSSISFLYPEVKKNPAMISQLINAASKNSNYKKYFRGVNLSKEMMDY